MAKYPIGEIGMIKKLLGFYSFYKNNTYYIFDADFTKVQKKQKIKIIDRNEKKGKYKDLTLLSKRQIKFLSFLEKYRLISQGSIKNIDSKTKKEYIYKTRLKRKLKGKDIEISRKIEKIEKSTDLTEMILFTTEMELINQNYYLSSEERLLKILDFLKIKHTITKQDLKTKEVTINYLDIVIPYNNMSVSVDDFKSYYNNDYGNYTYYDDRDDVQMIFNYSYSAKYTNLFKNNRFLIWLTNTETPQDRNFNRKINREIEDDYDLFFAVKDETLNKRIILNNEDNVINYKKGEIVQIKFNYFDKEIKEENIKIETK